MARRIVGLVGKGKGPRIRLGQCREMVLEVSGLKSGAVVAQVFGVEVRGYMLQEDGLHPVPVGHEICFSYDGESLPICAVRLD